VLRQIGISLANAQFRRVPEGWSFRGPTLLLWARGRYYLVNDIEKAKIETRLVVSTLIVLVATFLGMLPLLIAYEIPSLIRDIIAFQIIYLVLINALHGLYHYFAIRSLLPSSPFADESSTLAERLRTRAQVPPVLLLAVTLLIGFPVLAFLTYQALASGGQDIAADIMAAYSGWFVVSVCVMLWAKRTGSTGQVNREQN
jgi:hypothetical protein